MKRLLILTLSALMALISCTEELKVLQLSTDSIEVPVEGSSRMISVTCGGSWTASQTPGTEQWCTLSSLSGKGNSNISLKVSSNDGGQQRVAEFTFSASGVAPVLLTVTQKGISSDTDDPENLVSPAEASGITIEPSYPNADEACVIKFNPVSGNPLYNHSGELYGHLGIVVEGEWMFVPTEWGTTDEKTHFTKVGDNSWELRLEPSIREYFGSGETPVKMMAVIVRNADGTIKSHEADQFCSVKEERFFEEAFTPDPVLFEAMPEGMKYGINYNSDNSVTFVLYDKDKSGKRYDYCYIVGDWNDWERVKEGAMKRDNAAGCWWITLDGFDPDKEYRFQYRLGNPPSSDIRVSDPYTEIVYDQWNDQYIDGVPAFPEGAKALVSAFQINRPEYNWQHSDFKVEDKNDLVIYEMLFRDFTTSKDIEGAMAQLDYIEDLGVNAIELMPIQEFDGNISWGYNPNHYFALDKAYGTREEYKAFIDECHRRGIAVIVDVVYNHATGSHTWAKMYWDTANNCTAENNPWFNMYPAHPYNVYHDFNHENEMVDAHVKESLQYLLSEYDIDGFRFDLTKGFTQKQTDPDVAAWGRYDASRVEILKDYADAVWAVNDNAVVIFEHLSDWDEEEELADYGIQLWRNVNHEYRSAVAGSTGNFTNMYSTSPFGGYVGYMESHDEERLCYGVGGDASSVTWGICGTLTSWGSSPDITMKADGPFFVSAGVEFTASDMFKIRGNSEWNDAYNYGASTKGYKLPLNTGYTLTLGSGSQDMAVPSAGTYDIYFSPDASMVWLMTPGQRPDEPQIEGGGEEEDPFLVAMRRAGCSAAFFLTVPGPKMIWQFGEIGYDYSINYNDRTGEKPVVTESYMADPARKALYDTYAVLLKFRGENPRFFDSDASFSWTPTGSLKKITCSVDGKTFHVVGNFGKGPVSYTIPAGSWTDYINGGQMQETITLKEGEFRLMINF